MNEKEIYKLIKKNEAAIRENLLRADELIEIIVTIDKFLDKNLKKDSLLYMRYRKLKDYKKPQSLWHDLEGYPVGESQKFIQPWVDIFKEYLGEKTIKKRLKTGDLWIESRIQGEDEHILVGRRDGSSEKAHIIVDGKTGEIRVEESQQAPEAVMSHIETILTLNSGKRVRSTRELIEELPPPKEKVEIKGEPVSLKANERLLIEQLSDFDKIKEVSKIQSQGYWQTNIQPLNVEKERISTLSKCEEIIQKSVLNLRGWPYPLFYPSIPILMGQDWIQVAMDYGDRIEAWGECIKLVNLFNSEPLEKTGWTWNPLINKLSLLAKSINLF